MKEIAGKLGLTNLSDRELLVGFAAILEELRARGVCRTSNNPVADYTEWLVCRALSLELQSNSNAGFDGIDDAGVRYEIKARRVTRHNGSLRLSAIRNLSDKKFDILVGVIFEEDFSIRYAAKIPHELIEPESGFSQHTNAHFFTFRPEILNIQGVEEITDALAT